MTLRSAKEIIADVNRKEPSLEYFEVSTNLNPVRTCILFLYKKAFIVKVQLETHQSILRIACFLIKENVIFN